MFNFRSCAAVAIICLIATQASAEVTYHFEQNGSIGSYVRNGELLGTGPFTFDFTIANALAANHSYNFGVAGVESGFDGNVLDLRFSGGTALSTFNMADFFKVPNDRYYGYINSNPLSRLHLDTDVNGAIRAFSIFILGRSTVNTSRIFLGTLGANGFGIVDYYDPALGYHTPDAGKVYCATTCGVTVNSHDGSIVGGDGVSAVPEPETWALMVIGFGFVGGAVRRRQFRPAAAFI